MPLDLQDLLKTLCAAPGPSGHEAPVREVIRGLWAPLADEIGGDGLGSLWAVRRGAGPEPRPRLMLAAHMDSIGLLVAAVEGDVLRVSRLGSPDARVLPGQPVTVHGRADLPGVVAAPPAFLLPKNQRDGVTPLTELLVDTGLPAERLAEQVRVGDVVTFAQPPLALMNGYFVSPHLDNRASVAAVTLCLEALQARAHAWDVVAVATVQEEVGLVGAATSAFALAPTAAVAIDVGFGSDHTTREFSHQVFALGGGPTLGIGPNIHTGLHRAFKAAAERAEIPYAVEPMWTHSGTDAFAIQVAREGVPTMVVSIPIRNMHTPVEMVALKDIARAGRLLAEFAAGLSADFMRDLALD